MDEQSRNNFQHCRTMKFVGQFLRTVHTCAGRFVLSFQSPLQSLVSSPKNVPSLSSRSTSNIRGSSIIESGFATAAASKSTRFVMCPFGYLRYIAAVIASCLLRAWRATISPIRKYVLAISWLRSVFGWFGSAAMTAARISGGNFINRKKHCPPSVEAPRLGAKAIQRTVRNMFVFSASGFNQMIQIKHNSVVQASVLFLLLSVSLAGAVTYVWQPNPAADGITNYVLHWGTNSGHYSASTNCGNVTNFTIPSSAFFAGSNFVALTAQNIAGVESDFSAEDSFPMPSTPKALLRVKLSMDSAPSPNGPWTESISLTNSVAVQDAAYFRGRLDIRPSSGVP